MRTLDISGFEISVSTPETISLIPPIASEHARELLKEFGHLADEQWTLYRGTNEYEEPYYTVGQPHSNGKHYEDTAGLFELGDSESCAKLFLAAQQYFIPLLKTVALKGI